jgi:hypothetical protein
MYSHLKKYGYVAENQTSFRKPDKTGMGKITQMLKECTLIKGNFTLNFRKFWIKNQG